MKPTLFILAAGMGSRYGGLKQIDGVGPHGETIMDYSVYDAMRAGFGKVIFVIRHDFEDAFKKVILSKYEGHIPVEVVFQSVDSLPEGYVCPEGRTKPWGTNHAVLMGRDAIHEPFAVINADDYYGRNSFEVLGNYLANEQKNSKGRYSMVGFKVGNTVTENGTVSRGVCKVSPEGKLETVVEHTAIGYDSEHRICYRDADGESHLLSPETIVSMNFWAFTPDYFEYSMREFRDFLDKYINVEKSEFFIPSVVDHLIRHGEATVDVLTTDSQWFGVTYQEDRERVVKEFARLHDEGMYPDKLF